MAKWPQMASVAPNCTKTCGQLRCRKTLHSSSKRTLQVFRDLRAALQYARPAKRRSRVQHPTLKREPLQTSRRHQIGNALLKFWS